MTLLGLLLEPRAETWVQVYATPTDPWRISPPGLAPGRVFHKATLGPAALDLADPTTTVTEVNGGALIRRWERQR